MLEIGDTVVKKSGRPFKNQMISAVITDIGINDDDPLKRQAAIFEDGSACNLDMLKLKYDRVAK